MNISDDFCEVEGMRVHYQAAGDESQPVVILLHGGGIDCAELSWGLLLPELAQTHRVIAPDLPGYGESERPPRPYGVKFYVDFLTAFLDQLHLQRASLVGISMGGAIALGFTLQAQQRVEKLVLVDSYGLQEKAPFQYLSYLFIKIPGINELTWATMRSRAMVRYTLQALLCRPGSLTPALLDRAYQEVNRPNARRAWNAFQKDEVQPTRLANLLYGPLE